MSDLVLGLLVLGVVLFAAVLVFVETRRRARVRSFALTRGKCRSMS